MDNDKAAIIKRIRGHFSALGVDTSNMTDDEIEQRVIALSEALSAFGWSAQEFADNLYNLFGNVKRFVDMQKSSEPEEPQIDYALDGSFSAEARGLKEAWKKLVTQIAEALRIDKMAKWLNDKPKGKS